MKLSKSATNTLTMDMSASRTKRNGCQASYHRTRYGRRCSATNTKRWRGWSYSMSLGRGAWDYSFGLTQQLILGQPREA